MATATWCQPCQQLKQRLGTDPTLQPILAEYICLSLDVENDQADFQLWSTKYRAEGNGIPQMFIVTARGDQLFSCAGAPQGPALNSILSDNLAAAKNLAADAQAAQGQQADPVGPVAGPVAANGQDPARPFGPLPDNEEDEPVEEEPAPAVVVEEPAEPARPPAREPAAEEDSEDPELTRAQLDRRLDGWLRMANSFSETRPEKTREYVQRILELAPTSSQAAEARVLLRSLN